jgi:hypothetical protein
MKCSKCRIKNVDPKKRLFANLDIVFREEGKEALLFDPSTGSIKVLNNVGKMVWKFLDGKSNFNDIKNKLIKKFDDTDSKTIGKDLNSFLCDLEDYGYIGKKI